MSIGNVHQHSSQEIHGLCLSVPRMGLNSVSKKEHTVPFYEDLWDEMVKITVL